MPGRTSLNFGMSGPFIHNSGGSRIPLRRGRQLPRGGRQHTILPYFPKNCMKLKEFGPQGDASLAPPLDPPLHNIISFEKSCCYYYYVWQGTVKAIAMLYEKCYHTVLIKSNEIIETFPKRLCNYKQCRY